MESNWKNVNLGNYAKITMGQSPESQFYNEELNGIPFLQGSKTFGDIFPKIEKYTTKTTKLASENSIIFSVRAPVGDVNIAPTELCIGRGLAALESRNNHFLYYLLKFNKFKYESYSSGTVFSSINKKSLETMIVRIPNEKNQDKIAEILWNLDSKIELNNQIISNLEELASTLFKRWFVDFEFPDENGNPYKSSGGKMVDSELGEIPEGWEITELKSIVDVVDNRGKTPPLEKDKTDFPIIDVKTLSGNGRVVNYNKAQKYVSEETYSSWFRSGHPKINDILISTVGSIGEIKMFLTDKGTIAQNVVGLRAKKHLEYHLYQFLLYNKSNLITYNIGSVQPSIKVTHLLKHKVLLPNKKDLNKFNSVMIGLTDKIINLSKEINSLTETRDSLLPKLLSGEIELTEDEGV